MGLNQQWLDRTDGKPAISPLAIVTVTTTGQGEVHRPINGNLDLFLSWPAMAGESYQRFQLPGLLATESLALSCKPKAVAKHKLEEEEA